jgi:SAM-dependent methyltransferase
VADRVLVADCGDGGLLDLLGAAGADAYGVDPSDLVLEPALARGLDVRSEGILDHLGVVATEALGGMVLTGSVQWLRPNERERLVDLVATRLAVGGTLVLHSGTPEGWAATVTPVVRDLAPGHPLHAQTWAHLLGSRGFAVGEPLVGGRDDRIARVGDGSTDAASVNAAIDVINNLLLGPTEYLVVATRER